MKRNIEDITLDIIVYFTLIVLAAMALLPFSNVVARAFSQEWAVISGNVGFIPVGFQLETMKFVVTSQQFIRSFSNTVFITVVGTLLSVLLTAVTAYPLSKRYLPGVSFVMVIFIFTMMFNGGIVPNYILIRELNLINNLWSLILPALIAVFNLLVVKSYYESLPEELEESAKMDGASHTRILFQIIIPLSTPVIATISLFYAVHFWNDYFNALLYISKPSLKPLQLYLQDIVADAASSVNKSAEDRMNAPSEGVRSATVIAATVPIILVYPFLQKYFIKGMLIGSVKG